MNKLRATIATFSLMAIGSVSIFLSSCSVKSIDGGIVFTRTAGNQKNLNYDANPDSITYEGKSQIVALNTDKPGSPVKILTGDFYSARSPEISFDGKYMLFAARQKQNDTWQIWEMNLGNLKARPITSSKDNCTDPAYLPLGRIVFSKFNPSDTLKSGHSLYTCNLDGNNLKRITFNPYTYFYSNILNDGRVLTLGRQIYPTQGDPAFMILRPDGTKADLFYKGSKDTYIVSAGVETSDGRIVFIEHDKVTPEKGKLVSISYNRPLHSRIDLTSHITGDFRSVRSLHSGKLLVSYRKSESDRYTLYEFDPKNMTLGKVLYNDPEYDALQAVEGGKRERPKKLPSEVDMGVKTGLLLCQDINFSDIQPSGTTSSAKKASRIEIIGLDSLLGSVEVSEDGSFYLKVLADKPFQIQTVDNEGHVLRGPGAWIWLRPNERRGCVGCHQDPEIVPENRVPLAVKKSPVIIPMHINKVVEKKVSLE
jgi:hypothetical protein